MGVASYWRKQVGLTQWSVSRATLYEIGTVLLAGASTHFISPLAAWAGTTWVGAATGTWLNSSGSMLAFGLLIYVMAMGRGRISAWLSHPVPVLLGEISFSLYLLHQILLRYYQINLSVFPVLPNMLSLAIFWTVVLLASYLMWSLIEMPCRRWMLGRGQKEIHGTKVMLQSWHSHLNLNRKTLSAAAVLTCLVVSINFTLENNPNRISEAEADSTTPNNLKSLVGTRFGDQFLLRGVGIVHKQEGLFIYLAWESLVKQDLTYTTRLYLTDIDGNNLFFASLKQPKTRTAEKSGALWGETMLLPADKLRGMESKLAIAVYQVSSDPLRVDRGNRDRDNHRLLIDLGDAAFPTSPQ